MNTWSFLSMSLLGGVPLISLFVLAWCAKRAPDGYEDAEGFHSKQVYYDAFSDAAKFSKGHLDNHSMNSAGL